MFGRDENRGRVLFPAAVILVLISSLPAAPVAGQPRLEPASGGTPIEVVLRETARAAGEKLAQPSCRLVFSDFRSLNGRRLQDTLDALGQTGQTYFRGLVFYDGSGQPACSTPSTIAFTSPGSRVIFLCSQRFLLMANRLPGLAAALLIHEELHALGLGENPPSAGKITDGVIARCGM